MTAPISFDNNRTGIDKPIPYGFLRYPGSWFYLIATSVLGLVWIVALMEAVKMGVFSFDHLQEYSLQRAPSAVPLFLGLNSARTMYIQLKFTKMNLCGQQVGPKPYLGFSILGWLNFFGWLVTGLMAHFTLPNLLFFSFFHKLYFVYGMPVIIWTFWSMLHELFLMDHWAKRRRRERLSSVKDCHPA